MNLPGCGRGAGPQLVEVAVSNGSLALMASIASLQPSADYPRMDEFGAGMFSADGGGLQLTIFDCT